MEPVPSGLQISEAQTFARLGSSLAVDVFLRFKPYEHDCVGENVVLARQA